MTKSTLAFFLMLCIGVNIHAQFTVSGKVTDAVTQQFIVDAEVNLYPGNKTVITNTDGTFFFAEVPKGNYQIIINFTDHVPYEQDIEVQSDVKLGQIELEWANIDLKSQVSLDDRSSTDNIPTIILSENDFNDDLEGGQDISGILTASRDVFVSTAAFNWSAARFRIRGLGSEYSDVYVNGIQMNDKESDFVYWGTWGGLNDMFRLRQNDVGMGVTNYAFGGIGGANSIDIRASRQRANTRVSYAVSNRSYRNRLMITHNTGQMSNGWAFSISASRRWAQEGYIPGTSYNGYSYFLGAEKKINNQHSIGLSVFGAPLRRGKSFPGTRELYDLAGTNYYNSNWGYQEGDKRNARIGHNHEPVAILRHDWTMNEGDFLTTSASIQHGTNGSTALNWFDNTRDPRPDYYRKLPSWIQSESASAEVEEYLRNNPDKLQLDWASFYRSNSNSPYTIENANGIEGNTVSGNIARYMIEDRRYDGTQFSFRSLYQNTINSAFTFQASAQFIGFESRNYKLLDDALGGDFWYDIDRFLLFNTTIDDPAVDNNIEIPNRVVRESEKFEYSYTGNGRFAEIMSQLQYTGSRVEAFAAFELGYNSFWRDGEWANGKFPNNSKGKSEVSEFLTYGIKGGITFKIDGRNYLYANGFIGTRAPTFRNSFTSPRTRNSLVGGLTTEKTRGFEAGYLLRNPNIKARITAYVMDFRDQFFNRSFFLDVGAIGNETILNASGQVFEAGFVNYIMTGIDKRHSGIEAATQIKLMPSLEFNAAASLGTYIITNRPTVKIILDQDETFIDEGSTVYLRNFFEAGIPQTALSMGLSYRPRGYWFLNLNLNYYDHIYMGLNPDRRRPNAVNGIEEGSDLYKEIVYQEKAPSAMTLDLFGGKSFKFNDYFVYLNVGINNLLNDQNIITGGFEQFRFDYPENPGDEPDLSIFPNRYFYMYGLNYFISATLSF